MVIFQKLNVLVIGVYILHLHIIIKLIAGFQIIKFKLDMEEFTVTILVLKEF